MKSNSVNISKPSRWIDFQLSTTPENDTNMKTTEINARRAANEFVNAPTHRVNTTTANGIESSAPAWGLDMAESIAADRSASFPDDTTEIVATGATEYTTTPATMNEADPVEFSELSHAGQCTDIYLHNTAEIYERYTVPAIATAVEAKRYNERSNARIDDETAWSNLTFWISWQPVVEKALQTAVKMVKKYDHMTPTAKDIEQVKRNYAAYIVESAKYEIENS